MYTTTEIVNKIKRHGFCLYDVNQIINVKKLRKKFDNLINSGAVNIPRRGAPNILSLEKSDLENYHKILDKPSNKITLKKFQLGEHAYRNDVVHVTAKNPLIDLPCLNAFVFNPIVQKIADCYLGGDSALGYVKVKKSYANNLSIRSSNHKFHFDDNAKKILKFLFYMDDVSTEGGAFQFVARSHTTGELHDGEQVTFEDLEVFKLFGKSSVREFKGPAGTCIIADTLGLHKEGTATKKDRYSVIVNYVLEPEYQGTRNRQMCPSNYISALPERQKRMARFLNIV